MWVGVRSFCRKKRGSITYQAINARQIVELQSYIAIIAIGYVLINFTIDALYVVLDPRIRRARA